MIGALPFKSITLIDTEFHQPVGHLPEPICLVTADYHTRAVKRVWADELGRMPAAPFPVGDDALVVAYYASAEWSCFLELGWQLPTNILDLFTEFRCLTNGRSVPCGSGLLGALAYFGLEVMAAAQKDTMRDLAIRGGPFTDRERQDLLSYCEADVRALSKLLPKMLPTMDWPRALLRGRYTAAVARMEREGVPVDVDTLERLKTHWGAISARLIDAVDVDYGVYVPTGRTTGTKSFSSRKWGEYLAAHDIPWPRLETGALDLSDDTFRQMARSYPEVAPIRELRHTLSQLRLNDLAVGPDSRNRCLLSMFRARSGRNQPSNSRFIFGPSAWLRALIQPEQGQAIAYVDWSQQEFGIAGCLSGDAAMMDAYLSGDPYLTFAKQAGAVPPDGTKETHGKQRDLFKTCALGVQYGMGAKSLSDRIGEPECVGRELLRLHRETYPKFWAWSQAAVDHAMLHGWLQTVFGWRIHVEAGANPRSLANFPMQANGAEMLRLACCLATERGIHVPAPIHDALLVEGRIDLIDEIVADTQAAMAEASRIVLDGFELRTDAEIVRWPDRYMDKRGAKMWDTIMGILQELESSELVVDMCL